MKPTTTTTTAPPCRPCAVREAPYTHVSAFQLARLPPSAPLTHCPIPPLPRQRRCRAENVHRKANETFCVLRFMTQREVHDIELADK